MWYVIVAIVAFVAGAMVAGHGVKTYYVRQIEGIRASREGSEGKNANAHRGRDVSAELEAYENAAEGVRPAMAKMAISRRTETKADASGVPIPKTPISIRELGIGLYSRKGFAIKDGDENFIVVLVYPDETVRAIRLKENPSHASFCMDCNGQDHAIVMDRRPSRERLPAPEPKESASEEGSEEGEYMDGEYEEVEPPSLLTARG